MMKKILLPIEETERGLKALDYVKSHYTSDEAELVLMMVDERLGYSLKTEAEAAAIAELDEKLKTIAADLEGYRVKLMPDVGKAGVKITRAVRETGADLIVMTKSSKDDMLNSIGSTADYVINNSPCDVIIVSEHAKVRSKYRGLVFKTAKGNVTLRGQLGDKQSECLLPSVNQDCIYHIEVTVGKIRFFHTSYNPDTRNWDQMPLPGQEVAVDIIAGESKDILVKADSNDGKADRIRIVNRDMKKEAVFSFSISAAGKRKNEDNENEEKDSDEAQALEQKPEEESGLLSAEAEAIMSGISASDAAISKKSTIEIPKSDFPAGFEAPEVPTFETEGEIQA